MADDQPARLSENRHLWFSRHLRACNAQASCSAHSMSARSEVAIPGEKEGTRNEEQLPYCIIPSQNHQSLYVARPPAGFAVLEKLRST
jgi:hypothetical protein